MPRFVRSLGPLLVVTAVCSVSAGCSADESATPATASAGTAAPAGTASSGPGTVTTNGVLAATAALAGGDPAPAESLCAQLAGDVGFWLDGVTDTANASGSKGSYLRCRYPHSATSLKDATFSVSLNVAASNIIGPTDFELTSVGWAASYGKGTIDLSVLRKEEPTDEMKAAIQGYLADVVNMFAAG